MRQTPAPVVYSSHLSLCCHVFDPESKFWFTLCCGVGTVVDSYATNQRVLEQTLQAASEEHMEQVGFGNK